MQRWKGLVAALMFVGGCVACGWCVLRQVKASIGYSIRVDCESLPPDDEAIEQWLKTQPGIVERTATVHRDGKSVRMGWIMVQSIGPRKPPVPDIRAALERFGYHGAGPIRDERP
jgi:hypothetical protein